MPRFQPALAILLVAFAFLPIAQGQSVPTGVVLPRALEGWQVVSKPEPKSDAASCVSKEEWAVTVSGGEVELSRRPSSRSGKQVWTRIKVRNGWLEGLDVGEFGGGLWLAPGDGERVLLMKENVFGFLPSPEGPLIFTGLAHLFLDYGHVYLAPLNVTGSSGLRLVADLGGAPRAFAAESRDTAIVVTTRGVTRIHSSGKLEPLIRDPLGAFPNSVAVSSDGSVYVGTELFVVRLVRDSDGYKEQWLAPKDCTKPTKRDYECVCGH